MGQYGWTGSFAGIAMTSILVISAIIALVFDFEYACLMGPVMVVVILLVMNYNENQAQ